MPTSTLRYSRFANESDDDSDTEEVPPPSSPSYPPNYKKLTPVRTLRQQGPRKARGRGSANGLLYHRANAVSSPKLAPIQPSADALPHIIGLGSTRGAPVGNSLGSLGSPGSSGSLRGSVKGGSPRGIARRLSWDSNTGLVRPPRHRRRHSHPLKENQTWHSHPLIRPLMQLVPEAFLSFLFWSLLVQFWGDVYWFQLQAGGIHPTLCYLLYLLTPALALGLAPVRNALASNPWSRGLLAVGGLLGMAGQLGESSLYRLTLAGSAVGVMGTLVFDGIWAGTAARRRRTGFGVAGGALLLQALTYAYGGRNPAATSLWSFLLVGAVPGVVVVLVVLYEDAVGWAAREGGAARLDEEHGEAGVEAFSDIGMDDVLSNDDWDESEVEAAMLLQARLQSGGFTATSGSGADSPRASSRGKLFQSPPAQRFTGVQSPPTYRATGVQSPPNFRLAGVQSPPARVMSQESLDGERREHLGGVASPGGTDGEVFDGRGLSADPKHPPIGRLLGTDLGEGPEGHDGSDNRVVVEIGVGGGLDAAKQRNGVKVSKMVLGKRGGEGHTGSGHRATQEIELCNVEEPMCGADANGRDYDGNGWQPGTASKHKGRAHQGVKQTAVERDHPPASALLHARHPHHGDLEAGFSGESQTESADGEREAEPMLVREGPDSNETWQFLPRKVVDLGRRFGEGEEVPWAHGREETPFSEQDTEFEVFRERGGRWTKAGTLRTLQMGLSLGALLFLTHWLLTAPTLPARWAGLSPWWGVLSPLSLMAGIALAAEGAKLSKQLHGFGAWAIAAVGCLLMLLLGAPGAILGAVLVAVAAPSLWVTLSRNTVNVYPGCGVAIAALVHVSLALWSSFLVAYGNVPGGMVVRGTAVVLVVVALGQVALGLGKGPPLSAEDRRLMGAMLGAWKAGRPNWGSGVPGRKAVGALAALVGALLLAAVVQRLLALPVTFHSAPGDSLRLLSFNVYQGYNRAGGNNFKAIENVIREQEPHFVMLQETDTMHIIQANRDMVDYLSLGLRMYSLATPATRKNTWGCAMLSRVPFTSAVAEVLPSEHGEAACFQHATVEVGGKTLHLMNAHFGEDDRDRTAHAQAVAQHIRAVFQATETDGGEVERDDSLSSSSNSTVAAQVALVLAGDFNSALLSPQYMEIVSAGVADARVQLYGQWESPAERDRGAGLVFVSHALNCTEWVEPVYDQRITADGNPVVVTFDVERGRPT